MDKKELKKVIKQLVRESLSELFLEMNLETIVEGVVKRSMKQVRPLSRPAPRLSVQEPIMESVRQPIDDKEEMRDRIKKLVGTEDSEWASIYQDTADHGHSVLDGAGGDTNPELVSEATLKQAGLIRDFSKFIK